METRKFIQKKLEPKDFTHKDAQTAYHLWTVIHTDYGGYIENDYTIHIWENGDFTISSNDREDFISISGETALAIRILLELK